MLMFEVGGGSFSEERGEKEGAGGEGERERNLFESRVGIQRYRMAKSEIFSKYHNRKSIVFPSKKNTGRMRRELES